MLAVMVEDRVELVCWKSKFICCVEVTVGQTLCCIYCVHTAIPNTVFNTVTQLANPATNTRKTVR